MVVMMKESLVVARKRTQDVSELVGKWTAFNLYTISTDKAFDKYKKNFIDYYLYFERELSTVKNCFVSITLLYQDDESLKYQDRFETLYWAALAEVKKVVSVKNMRVNAFKAMMERANNKVYQLLQFISNYVLRILLAVSTKSAKAS